MIAINALSTVIARYGNEGHQYTSGIAFAEIDSELKRAKHLAIERGLIKTSV